MNRGCICRWITRIWFIRADYRHVLPRMRFLWHFSIDFHCSGFKSGSTIEVAISMEIYPPMPVQMRFFRWSNEIAGRWPLAGHSLAEWIMSAWVAHAHHEPVRFLPIHAPFPQVIHLKIVSFLYVTARFLCHKLLACMSVQHNLSPNPHVNSIKLRSEIVIYPWLIQISGVRTITWDTTWWVDATAERTTSTPGTGIVHKANI